MEIVTNVGSLSLTENQILNWAPSGIWLRFSYISGRVIAVSSSEPSRAEIEALRLALSSLPDTFPLSKRIEAFNPESAIGREAQVFAVDRLIALAPYSYTLNELLRWKNFDGLKAFLAGLIDAGLALKSDRDLFNQILKDQGIDLDAI